MKRAPILLTVCLLTIGSQVGGHSAISTGDFTPGTGAQLRWSANYLMADTIAQFVVGRSYAPDDSYACGQIEHGFWHSDVHIPTVAEIKQTPSGQWVDAYAKVVTAGSNQFSKEFFMSEQDRTSAIHVSLGSQPLVVQPGDMVDVSGIISGSASERVIAYPIVTVRFPDAMQLEPFFVANRWLGGKGTDMLEPGGAGVLNTCTLVKTVGRVTYADTAVPAKFFYIDDGSGVSDALVIGGKTMQGLRVPIANLAAGNTIAPPNVGLYVAVTGICSPYGSSGKTYVQVRPRSQADIQVMVE